MGSGLSMTAPAVVWGGRPAASTGRRSARRERSGGGRAGEEKAGEWKKKIFFSSNLGHPTIRTAQIRVWGRKIFLPLTKRNFTYIYIY